MNMRKISAILSLLLLTTLHLFSQEKTFKIGIKVSPNVSWLKTENGDITLDKAPLKLGYGLVFDKMFAENYAIGTGLNVYNVGGMSDFTYGNKVADTTYLTQLKRTHKLSYVEIPVTLKLRTSPIAGMTYWGQFGLGVGYLFKAFSDDYSQVISDNHSSGIYSDLTRTNDVVEDLGNEIQDQMNPIRASMIIAAGVEYPISGSTYLMGGITYNGGLLSVYKMGDEVAKLTNGSPNFAADKMSFEKTKRKIVSNLIELNIGIIF
jgi:Outer membrane protein beta-barrel domain